MSLNTALLTGLSGIGIHSQMLAVAGNNIANVNTTAFKSSRASFETQIWQTLRTASGPSSNLGGTNPSQVGLGARIGGIERDFSNGPTLVTGHSPDLAIQGDGFFVLNMAGSQRFTRAGNFNLDRNYNLVSPDGGIVQGYGVDANFNVVGSVLTDVTIPVGNLNLAEATENVFFKGNLNASGDTATQGAMIRTQTLYSDAGATAQAVGTTSLSSLFNGGGKQLFTNGDVLTVTGLKKGGVDLPDHTFEIGFANTTGSDEFGATVDHLMQFLNHVIGIDATVSGGTTMAGGIIRIEGNSGFDNDLVIENDNLIVNMGATPSSPFNFTKTRPADGESARTTFVIFDSLGAPHAADLTMVLEAKTNSGTTWRYYAQAEGDTDLNRHLDSGTLEFDNEGQLLTVLDGIITLDLASTGAFTPQLVNLQFDEANAVSSLGDVASQLNSVAQDGAAFGTLETFHVNSDGLISGRFTNGLERNLGQIPLAVFANTDGLEELGANLYRPTSSSGNPAVVSALTSGAGQIVGSALEGSNVELGEEFINLINATTGFSASSRVITTSDRLIQELLSILR